MTQPVPTAKSARSYMPILALLLLLGLGTLWGGQTVLARFVAVSGVPAFGYAFWQMFGAGMILLIVNFRRGRGLPLTRETIRYYIIMGWIGSAIPTANMYIALAEIPAGVNAQYWPPTRQKLPSRGPYRRKGLHLPRHQLTA